MPTTSTDEQFLQRALELARRGIGVASPNPCVGAVVVDAGKNVVGTGSYSYAGVKHAEVLALEEAGGRARGGTLYINLEPHAHQGRTPPCTEALIGAGIRRVVASMPDPNPKVSGQGFEKLRTAGVQVVAGGFAAEARRLNESFARYIRHGVPLVTLKAAMTLDGKIAPAPGKGSPRPEGAPAGGWITGESARAHVQHQRHESDAILVGVGTILADDPRLTDRSGSPRRRPLLRVVLDSHLRIPSGARILSGEGNVSGDVLIFCCAPDAKKRSSLERRGVRIETVSAGEHGRPDLHAVLRRLREFEITSLMIEGGSQVNASVIASGTADKVFFYYAPKLMGGSGVPFLSGGEGGGKLREVAQATVHRFGEDFAVEGYLRDPYGE